MARERLALRNDDEPRARVTMHSPADTNALRDVIIDAYRTGTPLRVTGASTWLDAGRAVSAEHSLTTSHLTGVIEYTPGDLVITVRGGTSLGEIAQITAEHGQMLALDPFCTTAGLDSATIGATVATASSGPLSHGFGRVRDLVLGCAFVCGDGTVVRAGGRVVKNVAGFDLVRLTTGAWGTLGVVSEVSMRLHARPPHDETFAIGIRDASSLSSLVARLNSAPLLANASTLASLVILAGTFPQSVRTHAQMRDVECVMLCRAMGNRARVDAQRAAFAQLGDVVDIDHSVWGDVRSSDDGDTTIRFMDAPSRTAELLQIAIAWCDSILMPTTVDIPTMLYSSETTRDAASDAASILTRDAASDAASILTRDAARILAQGTAEIAMRLERVKKMGTLRARGPTTFVIEPLRGAVRVSTEFAFASRAPLPPHAMIERAPASLWASQSSPVRDDVSLRLRAMFDPRSILNPGILGA